LNKIWWNENSVISLYSQNKINMCLKCKPVPWSLADYEMAIKLKTEKIKPGEIVDGQMWIQVWQEIVNEKKTKRKTRKKLG